MPIQYTGLWINPYHEKLMLAASDMAELARQAKTEKSHAYADGASSDVAKLLFELSMATEQEICDVKANGRIANAIALCGELKRQAVGGTRTHFWAGRVCDNAVIILHNMQRLY